MNFIDYLILNPAFNGILAAFGWWLFVGPEEGAYTWLDLAMAIWFTLWFLATFWRAAVRYGRGWEPLGTGTEPWR